MTMLLSSTQTTGSPVGTIIMLVAMFAMLYFFFYMPQKRQTKRDNEMRSSMEVGDEVTTIGGIVGRVISVKDDTFVMETGSDRVKIRFRRSAVQSLEKLDMGTAADKK